MKDTLQYKGFIGTLHFSAEDKTFFGKIEGINDLITFEGDSVLEIIKAFHQAVDDYLEICNETGKEPFKSCKGSLNVRLTPELHLKALQKSDLSGISLNQFILEAVKSAVQEENTNQC